MNTTENNKLIAKFLGVKKDDLGFYEFSKFGRMTVSGRFETEFFDTQLKFHSDWNWLMEAVEKIINLKDVYAQEKQKVFNSIVPNIETTYNACVEFIKWFNQQQLTNS